MTTEDVDRFLRRLAEDEMFQRKLDTFVAAAGLSHPVAAADLVEFAAGLGFIFTELELRRATSHGEHHEPEPEDADDVWGVS